MYSLAKPMFLCNFHQNMVLDSKPCSWQNSAFILYYMVKTKLIINYWSNTRVKPIPIFIQRDVRPSSFMCFARWGTILKKKSNDLRKCIMTLTLKEVLLLSPSSLTAGDGGGSIRAVSQVNFSIMINSRWKLCQLKSEFYLYRVNILFGWKITISDVIFS